MDEKSIVARGLQIASLGALIGLGLSGAIAIKGLVTRGLGKGRLGERGLHERGLHESGG